MTTDQKDSAAEWKRASGVWHDWTEQHWSDRDSNPFRRRTAKDAAEPTDDTEHTGEAEQKHTL